MYTENSKKVTRAIFMSVMVNNSIVTVKKHTRKKQSPRQKWNSEAFAYANRQLALLKSSPELEQQLLQDYEVSNHIAANGKEYATLWAWKFNSLLFEYKQAHPFSNPS